MAMPDNEINSTTCLSCNINGVSNESFDKLNDEQKKIVLKG